MTMTTRTLCVAALVAFAAMAAQAQTCSTPEATLISPVDGSTLTPDASGFVTFTWCDASSDYFVIIETIPGAHDIFYAFTGGAGGAGQNFLTLPAVPSLPSTSCFPAPPIGCIPELGEHIYFTLDTVKSKTLIGSHQYNFTAPSTQGQAATTTAVDNKSMTASTADQNVTLTATVTSTSTVNQGTVTFQVVNGATLIGAAVTSAPLTAGSASAVYLLPGGTAAGSYTIEASYSGGANFNPSSGSGTLILSAPPPAPAATTTTVNNQTATSSTADQNVTLTGAVTSTSAVNEGTVTFQVVDVATNPVGSPVTSATVSNGSASVVYVLPGNTSPNAYTINANYSGGSNFAVSHGSGTLTVSATPPTQLATSTTASNNAVTFSGSIQHVTLTASVSALDASGNPVPVNEGAITFQVMDGATHIGTAVSSTALTTGTASVSYALPANTGAKTYTIQAAYSGGPDFVASSSNGTLTVNKAQSTTNFTSTPPAFMTLNQTYTPTASSTGDGTLTIDASGSCSIAGGLVTVTATSGTCTVIATESDGPNFIGSSATPQTISVLADFSFPSNPASVIISAPGGTGTTTLNITGQTGFTGTITFSCTNLPALSTCGFNPASVTGSGSTTITITTTAAQITQLKDAPGLNGWTVGGGITLAGVFLAGIPARRRKWGKILGLVVVALLLTGIGCGGGRSHTTIPGTPTGTFNVTVTGTSGALTHSTTFALTVQ